MQCKYCSKQIVDDSIYCSYCGREVELEREEDLHKQADCIIPGAPKKHCAVCGKSLPNSTVSDVCALCTIKQRNQERAEHLNDPPKQTSYQPKDRYDISDEFDNSVFEQNKNSYYRGEEEFSLEEEYSRPKKRSFKQSFPHDPAKKPKKGCAAPAVVIIIIVIVGLNLVFDVAGGILGAFSIVYQKYRRKKRRLPVYRPKQKQVMRRTSRTFMICPNLNRMPKKSAK